MNWIIEQRYLHLRWDLFLYFHLAKYFFYHATQSHFYSKYQFATQEHVLIILVLKAKRLAIVSSVGWITAWQDLSIPFLVPGQDFWCSPAYLDLPGDNLNSWSLSTEHID